MKSLKLPVGTMSETPAWSILLESICRHDQFDDWITDSVYFEDQLLNPGAVSRRMTDAWTNGMLAINGTVSVQLPRASGKAFHGLALPLSARLCAYRVISDFAPALTPKLIRDKVYGFAFQPSVPLFSLPGDGLGELIANAADNAILGSSDSLFVFDVNDFLNTAQTQKLEMVLLQNGVRPDRARFIRDLLGDSGHLMSVDDSFAFIYNYYLQPTDETLVRAKTNFFRYRDEYIVMHLADREQIAVALADLGLSCRLAAEFKELNRRSEMSAKVTPRRSEAEEVIGEFLSGHLVAVYECQTWDEDSKLCQTDRYEVKYREVGQYTLRELTSLPAKPNLQDALQVLPLLRQIHRRRKEGVLFTPPFGQATKEFKQYHTETKKHSHWLEQALHSAISRQSTWQISWVSLLLSDAGRLSRGAIKLLSEVARGDNFEPVAKSRAQLALARSSEQHPDSFWSSPLTYSSEHLFRESLLAARYLVQRGHFQAWEQLKSQGRGHEPELVKYLESNITTN